MISEVTERLISETCETLRHRLTRYAGLVTVSHYAAACLNLLTNVVMARWLGPSDYGLVAMITGYPILLWSFVGIKSISVTTRYIAGFRAQGEEEKLRAVVKLGYGLDLCASGLAFILVGMSSWWVSRYFYHRSELTWLMVAYAGCFLPFSLTGTSWAVLSTWERFRWLAIFEIVQSLLKLCLVAGFLLAGLGVAGAVIGAGLAQAAIGPVMLVTVTRFFLRMGSGNWWSAPLGPLSPLKKEFVGQFGWNYLLVTLSGLITQIPVMLLGRLRGPEEAGFYRLATGIVTVGSYLATSLGRVAYPVISARWSRGERESLNSSLRRWTFRGGLPAGLLVLVAIPLLPASVAWVFGPGYGTMVQGTQMMMLPAVIAVVFFWLISFYYALGRVGLWAKGYAVYTMVVIGSSWFVIQHLGFLGIAGLVAGGKALFTLSMLILFVRLRVE